MTAVATTIPQGVILALENAPSFYSPTPAYQSVTIIPPSLGGGCQFTRGNALITSATVDDNFWTAWAAENSQNPLLLNKQVFVT
jgi:hypothetical protein